MYTIYVADASIGVFSATIPTSRFLNIKIPNSYAIRTANVGRIQNSSGDRLSFVTMCFLYAIVPCMHVICDRNRTTEFIQSTYLSLSLSLSVFTLSSSPSFDIIKEEFL